MDGWLYAKSIEQNHVTVILIQIIVGSATQFTGDIPRDLTLCLGRY